MSETERKPAKIILRELADKATQDAWDAKARGEKIGWCASTFPQEIPTTMGLPVVFPENQAAASAAKAEGFACASMRKAWVTRAICARIPASILPLPT